MSDTLGIISFEKILEICLKDYKTKGKIFEIEKKYFYHSDNEDVGMKFGDEYISIPIGPAAGPHTQLSQNIASAYLMGSRFFELKTVQVINGKEMQEIIAKPCIDARNVGYNVEWSTELTIREAKEEYIKASVLLQVLAIELELSDKKDFVFNISVGYSLEGIESKEVSDFIDDMKEAKSTNIFIECIRVLKKNINIFDRFDLGDIDKISSKIINSVTASTLHGCKPEEVIRIGSHLIMNKRLTTYIKCNPTLLGYEKVREILDNLGYSEVVLREEDFKNDLQYDHAVEIMTNLRKLGEENGVTVGVKLTNTLPVSNSRNVLPGSIMYLSGKPLYPIALGVAEKFVHSFGTNIPISISGGIDKNNILSVLKTGIAPVTFSTLFLKPRGYINLKDLVLKLKEEHISFDSMDVKAVEELAAFAKVDARYKNKGDGKILEDTLPTYDCFKINCGICVDVCPNRANIKLYDEHFNAPYQIVHIENRCNECDNCHTFCTRGGFPYYKKITLYDCLGEFNSSANPGILKIADNIYQLRDESGLEYRYEYSSKEQKKNIEIILDTIIRDFPYLIT